MGTKNTQYSSKTMTMKLQFHYFFKEIDGFVHSCKKCINIKSEHKKNLILCPCGYPLGLEYLTYTTYFSGSFYHDCYFENTCNIGSFYGYYVPLDCFDFHIVCKVVTKY